MDNSEKAYLKFSLEEYHHLDVGIKEIAPVLEDDSEVHWLMVQAKLSREALERKVNEILEESNED